jgi:hypothetical protein
MNAYELANLLEFTNDPDVRKAVAMLKEQDLTIKRYHEMLRDKDNMLRQQADRIAELEKGGEVAGRFYWESVVDGHVMAIPSEGTPHYNKDDFPLYTTPQIKELSDEEIVRISKTCDLNHVLGLIDFARAILKKASEK